MENITIIPNAEEIIKAKFLKTFLKIEGYLKEAEGDIEIDQSYSANAVHGRISRIKESFENDLENLIQSIKVS